MILDLLDATGKIECDYVSIQFDRIHCLERLYDVLILDECKGYYQL